MSVKNPQVIEGARGPRDEREAIAAAPRTAGHDLIPAGKRVYQAAASKYMLQLTSPEDQKLPDGRTIRGKPLRAVFKDGFLVLDTKKDKTVIDMLDESEYNVANGGTQFWDFQTILDATAKSRRDSAIAVLSDPVDRKAILDALRAEGIDFELPKTQATQKGTTPAAGA